ncbi:KUP/HAK/KT family potassium transporter [Streptomyces puniciscabiei]
MVSVLTLVFAFRSSATLPFAFGTAVTGTITIATLLFFYVARAKWRTPLWLIVVGATVLLFAGRLFVAANMTKLIHGALPLLIGLTVFTVMTTWQRGLGLVTAETRTTRGPAPRVHRRPPLGEGVDAPDPRDGRVPRPRQADRAPGHAGQDRLSATIQALTHAGAAASTAEPQTPEQTQARPAIKEGPLHEALGITISYEHATRTATVRSRPSSPYRQSLCPRGDLNPHAR